MRIRPTSPWSIILCLPLGLLACFVARYAVMLPWLYEDLLQRFPILKAPFLLNGIPGLLRTFTITMGVCAVLFIAGSLLGLLVRRIWVCSLLHRCFLGVYVLCGLYLMVVGRVTGIIMTDNIRLDSVTPDPVSIFFMRWHLMWPAFGLLAVTALLHLLGWRRAVLSFYSGVHDDAPASGDLVIENILSNGRDPQFRKSMILSVGLHFLIIIVIPWLLSLSGGVEDYKIQKGSGAAQVMMSQVKVKVQKVKKKKKKFRVNKNSAILFNYPDLDDSQVAKDVDKASEVTYVADPTRVMMAAGSGKMGGGNNKNGPGGWPEGSENAKFRFIRMEYNGAEWDDGMDEASRADRNFLDFFRKITGFKTAEASESHPIASLRKYKKGLAPPFVFMTGGGNINVSPNDARIMREYLLDGGMLFGDCGSPQWDRAFRSFMQQVVPGEQLRVIADDDPIFQMPFVFPNGAPPLWHHGGNRAMGIKAKGRWIVFYHPGDINDAWKTGHSGLDSDKTKGAMEMGVNIVYYAFTHYLEETRKYRK